MSFMHRVSRSPRFRQAGSVGPQLLGKALFSIAEQCLTDLAVNSHSSAGCIFGSVLHTQTPNGSKHVFKCLLFNKAMTKPSSHPGIRIQAVLDFPTPSSSRTGSACTAVLCWRKALLEPCQHRKFSLCDF